MARKKIERNISYDDTRDLYYVHMELGVDEDGRRVKQYRTYTTLAAARAGLRQFMVQKSQQRGPIRREIPLEQWLDYWMENIVRPNRAETTTYGYERMIENHIAPHLGAIPISKLTPQRIQEYYLEMAREGLGNNTIRRHHALLSAALRVAVRQ